VSNHVATKLDTPHQRKILDIDSEQTFDQLTSLGALLCDTPIAAISLIDTHH
jgi:hypothetical protein